MKYAMLYRATVKRTYEDSYGGRMTEGEVHTREQRAWVCLTKG